MIKVAFWGKREMRLGKRKKTITLGLLWYLFYFKIKKAKIEI